VARDGGGRRRRRRLALAAAIHVFPCTFDLLPAD